jgi:hypothetical protein
MLDADLLEEAKRVLGMKTHSATVNHALAEVIGRRKILSLPLFFGSRLWQGDFAEMRGDRGRPRRRSPRGHRGRR